MPLQRLGEYMELDYQSLCSITLKDSYRLKKLDNRSFVAVRDDNQPGAVKYFQVRYEGQYNSEIEGPVLFFSRQKGERIIDFELKPKQIRLVIESSMP